MSRPRSSVKRILVVDDSAAVRDAVSSYVRRMGHEVYEAPDGRTAVELAASVRPEVALIDLWMPVMDGYQVVHRLRQELGAAPRLVAMTAHATAEARAKCLDAGFDLCVSKPLDPAFLSSWLGA